MTAHAESRGQQPISRFAPSPTGMLHLGHAYSAVMAHDLARTGGGQFLVRIEDIDEGRCRSEFVQAIFDDLRWLGLGWDSVSVQSEHGARYRAALEPLQAAGLVYRCICTRAEIAASATAPQDDVPPVYPGTCRGRTLDNGPAAWRLDIAKAAALGDPARAWGDVVIARKDALASYHLAVVVDDAAGGVTDVVRGRDLVSATDVHRLLQRLLGLPTPRYHHHPLVCDTDGKRLAKRIGSTTLAELRAGGMQPDQLVSELRAGRLPIGFTFDNA